MVYDTMIVAAHAGNSLLLFDWLVLQISYVPLHLRDKDGYQWQIPYMPLPLKDQDGYLFGQTPANGRSMTITLSFFLFYLC